MNRNFLTVLVFLLLSVSLVFSLPSCTISSPSEGDYNSKSKIGNFDYSCTNADTVVTTINGSALSTGSLADNSNIIEGSNTILVHATDTDGNSTDTSMTFKYDTTAPTGSFNMSGYITSTEPELKFESSEDTSGWSILLTCDTGEEWDEFQYASTIDDFDVTDDSYGCSSDLEEGDTVKVYAKLIDKAGNVGSTINSGSLIYDSTSPNFSEDDFGISVGDTEVTVTWSDPDDEEELYSILIEVYLNDTDSLKKSKLIKTLSDESYTVTGLSNGSEYYLILTLTDEAGNVNTLDGFEYFTPQGNTAEVSVSPAKSYAKNGDKFTVNCSFSDDDTQDAVLKYRYVTPDTSYSELDSGDTDQLSSTFTIGSGNYIKVQFHCSADDASSSDAYIYIDNTSPKLEWGDNNNLFVGLKRITIKASDNIALDEVDLDFNGTTIELEQKDANLNYYYDLNSAKYENGNYTIKATATDKAGNSIEISRTATFDNYLSLKQLAEKTINSAKEKQKTSVDLVNYYKEQALIIPAELSEKKNNADTLLISAENKFSSGLYEDAKSDANNAIKLFDEFSTSATTQVKQTLNYSTDDIGASEILQKYGLTQEEANSQINEMKTSKVTRKMVVIQSGTSNNRQVKIEISFTNDTNSDIVKIIEVIPKELVESAKSIVSDENFRIIKDDPVIEFTVPIAKGASATISYGIGEVTSIKADELVSKNIIDSFETSPIMLEGTITTEEKMKNLSGSGDFALMVIGVVIIIILLIAIIFIAKFKNPGHGFGEEKTLFEHATAKENPEPKKKFEAFK